MLDPNNQVISQILGDDGQVRPEIIDDLLVEVVSGKSIFESDGQLYASRQPTMAELDAGRIVYRRRLFEARKAGLPTRVEMEARAIQLGIFDAEDRQQLRALEAMIQRVNSAREHTGDPRQKVELAAQAHELHTRMVDLRMREEEVFYHSAETKAEEGRMGYLVSGCTLAGELLDQPFWEKGWDDFKKCTNHGLVFEARNAFLRAWHGLPIKIIRAIARTGEWRARWKAARETGAPVFDGMPAAWDANKRNLAWWSDFYDAVHKHPECPPEETIRDDDSLQDWMNKQIAKVKRAAQGVGAGGAAFPPQRTFLDGRGRRISSQQVGSETHQVNEQFRVRV
jgi:hypothetical protein